MMDVFWVGSTLVSWIILFVVIWYLYRQHKLNQALLSEITQVRDGVRQGSVAWQVSTEAYQGHHLLIIDQLNALLRDLDEQYQVLHHQLELLSDGHFEPLEHFSYHNLQEADSCQGMCFLLKHAIANLRDNLLAYEQMVEQEKWMRDGLVYFIEQMINLDHPHDLLDTALEMMVNDSVAVKGAVYLYLPEQKHLSLKVVNGYNDEDVASLAKVIELGQGLIGTAAAQKTVLMHEASVSSMPFEGNPAFNEPCRERRYALPILCRGKMLQGVVELVFDRELDKVQLHYITHISEVLASYIFFSQQVAAKEQLMQELQAMVQAVFEVMTKVNQAQWHERITLDLKHPELLDLKTVINESIEHIHRATHKVLHQERLSTIGNMAAAMAHEINNPIAGIMMNLSYLADVTEQEDYHEVVSETLAEVKRVGRLVKSMLSFSRTSDGIAKPFDLYTVVVDTFTMMEPLAKTSGILLCHDLQSLQGMKACGDADNLKQVLLNLVTNSVQAMSEAELIQKQILLSVVAHSAEQVVLAVADTGTGIPEQIQDKIFDPFFTTKPQGEGTGLGLAICLKLMEDFGGSLSLDKDYTQGARFLITIPLLVEKASEVSATTEGALTLYELSLTKALASAQQPH